MTSKLDDLGNKILALQNNQRLLQDARRSVLSNASALSHQLLAFRVNPSNEAYPLAYRRVDRKTLETIQSLCD